MRGIGTHAPHRRHTWLAVALPACSLMIALGPDNFPLITARAFLLQGAALLLIAGILLAVCGRTWTVDGAVLSAMICIGPTFLLKNKTNSTATGSVLFTLAQMNVHRTNSSFACTMAAARARGADILSVQEVDARWEKALVEGLADLYPYHVVRTADDNYGIALFSRSPFEDHAVFDLNGLPAIRATVRLNELDILVLAVHLRSPESRADLKQRNMQWAALADLAINAPGPVLVVGDLNTVPWDNAAKHFNMVTSLAWGPHPLSPTWPSIAGLSLIPLDHMLTSPGLCILDPRTFIIPGSDHQGLSATIAVNR